MKRLHDNFLQSNCWRRRAVYLKMAGMLLDYMSFGRYRELKLFKLSMELVRDRVL